MYRQKDGEFEVKLGYVTIHCLKTKQQQKDKHDNKRKIHPLLLALRKGVNIPGCPHTCYVAEELVIFLLSPPHSGLTGQAPGSILDFEEGCIYFAYVHVYTAYNLMHMITL